MKKFVKDAKAFNQYLKQREKEKEDIRSKELRHNIRITAIVVLGVLGIADLIGIFWGKSGLLFIGQGVLAIVVISILATAGSDRMLNS